MKDYISILFISNGHGEDSIAVKVIDRLLGLSQTAPTIHAWPMVGEGRAYRERGIPLVGARNLLPSCGFATLSLKLLIKDLLAGWLPTHWRQVQAARALGGQYSLIAAVGDIVVISAAVLAKTPFFFIGCAKSSYYSSFHGYTRLEKYLLRKHCLMTFPRDRLTVTELDRARVANLFLGNPMMDDLESSGISFGIPVAVRVVGCLPGSRPDARENALHLLEIAGCVEQTPFNQPLHFLFAAHNELDMEWLCRQVTGNMSIKDWLIDYIPDDDSSGVVLQLIHRKGAKAWFVKGCFADVLHRSAIVVGTAGTANEQAVGLGKPLITFPSRGVMGKRYVKMKMQFFGPAALEVSPEPIAAARAIAGLLADNERQEEMIKAGKERMGKPGASLAIARRILSHLAGDIG